MYCQPSGAKGRAKVREEVAAKRRPNRKAQGKQKTQVKKPKTVIDLTTDDEKNKENQTQKPMENPVHLESDDYFEILSLQRSASESDVKRAYRKLAVQWHPDKNRSNPRAEEFFKKISEAYEVLSDPEKRKVYEKYGKAGLEGAAPAYKADEHFGFSGHRGFSTQHARDIFDAFFGGQDPFEAFFGGRQRRGSQRRGFGFGDDPFESMGFGMDMGMNMRGFGSVGGMSMMDSFFDGFGGMDGSTTVFSTCTSSSSSTFTDRNGQVITQKTTTTTDADGRTETVTEEYRNGKLVNSTSSTTGSRLADAGRMQLEGNTIQSKAQSSSYQRRGSRNSRPKY